MKHSDWKKLALLGMSSGFLLTYMTSCENSSNHKNPTGSLSRPSLQEKGIIAAADLPTKKAHILDPNDGNMNYHLMTEDELMLELNAEGIAMYKSLSPEGKKLAREVSSMSCNGTNKCKGLNACKSDKNSCLGKGECKGQGICAVSDKNLAVKLVHDKMANKRSDAMRNK